jgi:hypothetical protein
LADTLLQRQLGAKGCLACRSPNCRWYQSVDVEACVLRRQDVIFESERVRTADKEVQIFNSVVALSALEGGNKVFRREDLIEGKIRQQSCVANV